MKSNRVVGVLLVLVAHALSAQEISVSGEYRINPVYSRGFREPMYEGDKAGFFTMQRTRLIFNYKSESDLNAEIVLQDRRFWGDQEDRADVANIAVFRAWVEKYFTPKFSVKLGRQGFVYDEQQLLSDPNWVGTRAHDAALFKYETAGFKAHLAAAFNANGQELKREVYDFSRNYKDMEFLWLEKEVNKSSFTFIFINRGMEKGDTSSVYTQTFGPYADIHVTDKLSFRGLYYYQMGETTDGLDVSASFYSAQLIYEPSKTLWFNAGVDAGSGTDQSQLDNPSNTKSGTFDRLYGLHHGKFGYIDYFYINKPTWMGVQDYYLKAKVGITEKLSVEDHIHNFETWATIDDPNDGSHMSHHLGVENDILLNYKVSSTFKATLAHSIMFGSATLDQFFGGQPSRDNQVFYAVITATPNFFKTKIEKK